MTGAQSIYVYGVVASGDDVALPEAGVADEPTRLIESNGLAAVVSTVSGDRLRVRRRDLHAHLAALNEVFRQTTIVPCAFGTVLASEDDVRRQLLEARADELHALTERLAGQAQMNVRAAYDEPEVLRDLVASDPAIAAGRRRVEELGDAGYYARIQLGEQVAAALGARRDADADRIHGRLAPLATDASPDRVGDAGLDVYKASFLVSRSALDRFDRELEELASREAPLIRFESFGPLPPTAFATLEGG